MGELGTWLRAQLDAVETETRNLLAEAQRVSLTLKEPRLLGREIPGWHSWRDVEQVCVDRLAELAVMRRVVDEHDPTDPCDAHDASLRTVPCDTVLLVALAFARRPGYQERWRLP
ncbi:DUF6221 family protein [Micromonospora tulbaghiae]|uniref:DUF6221 family protein n=1 Tax=Micromonospora tulbaghiae TaxID=479978 RepID=UPI00332FF70A